jgi:hypothetical protein
VIHSLLVLALVVLVIWFFFSHLGGFIHLLLIGAIVLAVLWLLGFMRGRSTTV